MSAADPFGLVGQVLDGQFRVDKLVGEGGFSAVYGGHHQGLNEPIAIKCLKLPAALGTSLVDTFVQRFRDESRILYRLSQGNLNVVRSIAAGTTQAPATGALVPYMVLEWLEGRSMQTDFMTRRAAGEKGRSIDEVIKLFDTAADGLAYAHAQGVVHRDLNPGNLFLASTQHGVKMKVLDFGVAKLMHDGPLNLGPRAQTVGQIKIFAPAYGAPEQFDDRIGQVGTASDVYSFALVLLEALRDRNVVEGSHLGEFAQTTCDPQRRPTPRSLGIDTSDEVEQAFTRATLLDPAQRWRTASEFWQSLAIAQKVATERKHEQAARETPPLTLGGPAKPAPKDAAIGGKNLARTMPLGASTPGLPPGFPRPGGGAEGAGAPRPVSASRVPTTLGIPAPATASRVGGPPNAARTLSSTGSALVPPPPSPNAANAPLAPPAAPPRTSVRPPSSPRNPAVGNMPPMPSPPRIPPLGGAAAKAPSERPGAPPRPTTDRPAAPTTARFPAAAAEGRESASMAAAGVATTKGHARPAPYEDVEEEHEEATKVHAPTAEVLATLALHDAANARAAVQAAISASTQGGDSGDEASMLEVAARSAANKPPHVMASEGGRPSPVTPLPPSLGGTMMMPPGAPAPAPPMGGPPPPQGAPPGGPGLGSTVAMMSPTTGPQAGFTPPPYQSSSIQGMHGMHGMHGMQGMQGAPPMQGTEPLQMHGMHGMSNPPAPAYGQGSAIVHSQGAFPYGAPGGPGAAGQSGGYAQRPSLDQPPSQGSFAQQVAAPAKPLPVVPIAIGLAVLALGGIGLGVFALRARRAPVVDPVTVASSDIPTTPASVTPVPVPVADPPPAATTTAVAEVDAAPAVAEVEDAATAAVVASAAPSASASAATTTTTTAAASAPPPQLTAAPPTVATVATAAPPPTASAKPAVDANAFNESAARSRLAQANGVLVFCKKEGGVTGPGNASITFGPDGSVTGVAVEPPYAGTKEGDCVTGQFRRAKVSAFTGAPQTVRHGFEVPK